MRRLFYCFYKSHLQDNDKYLRRQHQDFSEVLTEARAKIPQVNVLSIFERPLRHCFLSTEATEVFFAFQEPLKSSVLSSMRSMLRSFTDVCDAVHVVEIGLRFLGKTGGDPQALLFSYLTDSLKLNRQISSSVAEVRNTKRKVFFALKVHCMKFSDI